MISSQIHNILCFNCCGKNELGSLLSPIYYSSFMIPIWMFKRAISADDLLKINQRMGLMTSIEIPYIATAKNP